MVMANIFYDDVIDRVTMVATAPCFKNQLVEGPCVAFVSVAVAFSLESELSCVSSLVFSPDFSRFSLSSSANLDKRNLNSCYRYLSINLIDALRSKII